MGQCTSGELPPSQLQSKKSCIESEVDNAPINNGGTEKNASTTRIGVKLNTPSWIRNQLSYRQKTANFSDTFNLMDHSNKSNLVNINTATEEELMTLPGITRQLAHDIVEYRTTIGGFRRVEDLALVSGIGAFKLQNIKKDITIKKYPSYSSSRTQSMDSLPSCDSVKSMHSTSNRSTRSSTSRFVNINTSSIFELMTVQGMTQEMAANIVHYRTKRGPFKTVDQLVKVRGINSRILYMLSNHLICGTDYSTTSPIINDSVSVGSCGQTVYSSPKSRVQGHRRTQSEPLQVDGPEVSPGCSESTMPNLNHRFSSEFSADLFELLSLRSDRPIPDNVFKGSHDSSPAIRIGSWNLQNLSIEKIHNLGVLEVICRTILENGFSILAVQDIRTIEVLEKICGELNEGSLRRIREWNGPKGEWLWATEEETSKKYETSNCGFIYNASHGLKLRESSFLSVHNNNNSKSSSAFLKPYFASFSVNDAEIALVNLHIKGRKTSRATIEEEEEEMIESNGNVSPLNIGQTLSTPPPPPSPSCLSPLIFAIKDKILTNKCNVILGSFSFTPDHKVFDILHESSHMCIVPVDSFTDISSENPNGTACFDNVWLNYHSQKLFTGSWGVVKSGLSHMAIPRGWGWGGYVSDHCPIYCDLFTKEKSYNQTENV